MTLKVSLMLGGVPFIDSNFKGVVAGQVSQPWHVIAGVVAAVLLVLASPTPLAVLIIGLIRAEAAQLKANQPSATAGADQSGEAETGKGKKRKIRGTAEDEEKGKLGGGPLWLPTEAHPLASLMALARDTLQRQQVPGCGTMNAPTDDEIKAQTVQGKKKRRTRADATDGSQMGIHRTSSLLQAAEDNLLLADVHVAGSDMAASQLSAYVASSATSTTSALSLMELQTALLCAPAATAAAEVPRLADLIMQQPDQAAQEMLVRVIQAHACHFIDRTIASLCIADTAGGTGKGMERLLDVIPVPMLLHALNKSPGVRSQCPIALTTVSHCRL